VRARAAELERSIASDGRSAPPQPGGCLVFDASIYRDLAPSGRPIDLKLTATECPSYGGILPGGIRHAKLACRPWVPMGPVAVRCHMPRVPHPQCTPGLPAGALAEVAAGSAWHCDSGSDGWHQPQAIHRGLTSECQRALSTARV
jgi:hypothetical protein